MAGWLVGWYPGGRGYRAPYGANNLDDDDDDDLTSAVVDNTVPRKLGKDGHQQQHLLINQYDDHHNARNYNQNDLFLFLLPP